MDFPVFLDKQARFADNGAMKKSILITLSIIGSAALVYANGVLFMQGRFPLRSSVNGVPVPLKTLPQAAQALSATPADYSLTITGREGSREEITGEEIGMHFAPASPEQLAPLLESSSPYAWPLYLIRPSQYTLETDLQYDASLLDARINSLSFLDPSNMHKAGNAYVGRTEAGDFAVLPGEEGTELDPAIAADAIRSAVDNGAEALSLEETGCYADSDIGLSDPALVQETEALNSYAHTVITMPLADTEEVLDASVSGGWLTYENGEVTVDENAVMEYVASLAERYDTFGMDRNFTTNSGDEILIRGGNYGWLLNEEKTVAALLEKYLARESGTLDPVFVQRAARVGEKDYGDTYIEVDLDRQHVWAYEEGKVVLETDCVSGKVTNGNFTPAGTYRVNFKQQDAILRGDDYATPVSYWMPFNLGIGFHDATWRGSFGGEIYVNGGSHGCVNLPFAAAQQLFEHIQPGEAVLVYGGKTPESLGIKTASAGTGSSSSSSSSSAGRTGQSGASASAALTGSDRPDLSAASVSSALGLTGAGNMTAEQILEAQKEAAKIAAQAQANYEATGLSPEEAAAKVAEDIAAQAAQQAQAQMSQQAAQAQAAAQAAAEQPAQAATAQAAVEQAAQAQAAAAQAAVEQAAQAQAAAAQAAAEQAAQAQAAATAQQTALQAAQEAALQAAQQTSP